MIKTKKQKTVCVVGAHSGGHIIPALTLAQEWLLTHKDGNIILITSTHERDRKVAQHFSGITQTLSLTLENVPRKKWWRLPLFSLQAALASIKSIVFLFTHKPDVIISTGGYLTLPIAFAAWLLRIPLDLYELNVVPGKAIHFLSPYARHIYTVFQKTKSYLPHKTQSRCSMIHYPLRYTESDRTKASSSKSKRQGAITIFIVGGSQGSQSLNTLFKRFLEENRQFMHSIHVIHQTGTADQSRFATWYKQENIPAYVFDYDHNMAPLYQGADVVITRAGAGTLAELAFFEKKSFIMPLKTSTTTHQEENAHEMALLHPTLFTVGETYDDLVTFLKNCF